MFVAFDTYKMRQDLKANNIDETKEYTKDDAVAALTPVLSDFLKKDVEGKISILVDDIAKATEYKKSKVKHKNRISIDNRMHNNSNNNSKNKSNNNRKKITIL